jgi:hypothetical protein
VFNRHRDYDRRGEIFKSSPGHIYDQVNRGSLWPVAPGQQKAALTADALEDIAGHEIEPWGWSPATHRDLPVPITPEAEEEILADCRRSHFRWNEEAWESFVETVDMIAARGIRLLLFIPPYHPLVQRGEAADFDGTGHKDYHKLVDRLRSLAANSDGIVFIDAHRGGGHDFVHEDFANPDHLHLSGTEKLTRMLVEVIEGGAEE